MTLPSTTDLQDWSLTNSRSRKTKGAAIRAPWVWFIGTIILAASVLFYRLEASPLELWDEARLANNALEMAKSGLSLITTYDGVPDHWNTKPPLLIWLMSISIRVFGPNEWAVRLPSASAALATVALLFVFCNCRLKRPFAGFAAVLFLLFDGRDGLYILTHAARSGDYDATLALWTTGYLLAGYMYIHDDPSKRRLWLLLCAVGIVLAFLTKTLEGLIFLPALLIYAVSQGRIVELLRSPVAYVSGAMVLLICAGYYLWREQIDPGYFAAVMQFDLLGRYVTGYESDPLGPSRYFLPWVFFSLMFAGFQLGWGRGERRQISVYLGVVSLFFLVVISFSKTIKGWYIIPVLPLSATIIGIVLDDVLEWMAMRGRQFGIIINGALVPFCVFAGLGVIAQDVDFVRLRREGLLSDEPNLASIFLRNPLVRYESPQKFLVIQQSFISESFYVAPTLFYVNALRATGRTIEILPPSASIPEGFNAAVICGETAADARAKGVAFNAILIYGKCGIYQLAAK
jgi:4-amino-4-deoxy-L-arabinose transferase-like glycosyltransferase